MDLRVTLATGTKGDGLTLANPVMAAAGVYGSGAELRSLVDPRLLGAIVTPAVRRRGRRSVSRPREMPAGVLTPLPYGGVSLTALLRDAASQWRTWGTSVIANLPADDTDECAAIAVALEESGAVAAVELDLGALATGGRRPAVSVVAVAVGELLSAIRSRSSLPVIVKLSLHMGAPRTLAQAAEEAGAVALTVGGGFAGIAIDIHRRQPAPRAGDALLSGPAIRPLMLRTVYDLAGVVRIPIIGSGGIITGEDAVEYLMAGATAVQVGAATLADPRAPLSVLEGLKTFMKESGETDVRSLTGAGRVDPMPGRA